MDNLFHALNASVRRLKWRAAPLRRIASDTRGNIAVRLALIAPGLILLGAGGADLYAVHGAHERLQGIADAGALAGATALATDAAAARARAAASVAGAMHAWPQAPGVEGVYQIVDQGGEPAIRVLLKGHRPSLLADMLPPGGWNFSGDATATSRGLVSRD